MLELISTARSTISRMPPLAIILWVVVMLLVFLGPLDISSDAAAMSVGVDGQVMVKLLVSGVVALLGVYGVIASSLVRQTLVTLPPLMLIGILILAALATPIAISGASLATTLINLTHVAFLITALATLRLPGMATAVLAGIMLTFSLSMFFWFFVPTYGEFPELLADGLIVVRMSGTAHPNAVGRAMVLGLILTLYLYRSGTLSLSLTLSMAIGLAYAAYLAWSRTAIIAGVLGITILFLDRLFSRAGFAAIVMVGLMGVAGLTAVYVFGYEDQVVGRLLEKVSKSGDAEEITSGTGRADIWARAMDLIAARPIIGHGFNAAPILMTEHSQATHNAVLHATLAAGIGGGVLMFGLLIWNLYLVFGCDSLLVRSLSAFTVLSCLTEDTVLETFPGPCTVLWLVSSFYPVLSPFASSLPNATPPVASNVRSPVSPGPIA